MLNIKWHMLLLSLASKLQLDLFTLYMDHQDRNFLNRVKQLRDSFSKELRKPSGIFYPLNK